MSEAVEWERRVDPEVLAVLDDIPLLDLNDISQARREREELARRAAAGYRPPGCVRTDDIEVAGLEGEPGVVVRRHRHREPRLSVPALLWVHGGGHVLGRAWQDDPLLQALVERTGCVVAAVEWRRSPEAPYPAALHDCYAVLRWLSGSADELGVDRERLVVAGASSGGGLAAATVLLARDRGEVAVAGQLLVYPMLDDRATTRSSRMVHDARLWNVESNRLGWSAYLSGLGSGDVPAYAAPSRATDLRGLPPTWIGTGELDLFRDEDVEYASRLMAAEVPTELHVYPGAVHGFDLFAPQATVARRFRREREEALDRWLRPVREGGAPRRPGPGNDSAPQLAEPLYSRGGTP